MCLWNQLLPPHHPHNHLHHQSTEAAAAPAFESDQPLQQDPLLPVNTKNLYPHLTDNE